MFFRGNAKNQINKALWEKDRQKELARLLDIPLYPNTYYYLIGNPVTYPRDISLENFSTALLEASIPQQGDLTLFSDKNVALAYAHYLREKSIYANTRTIPSVITLHLAQGVNGKMNRMTFSNLEKISIILPYDIYQQGKPSIDTIYFMGKEFNYPLPKEPAPEATSYWSHCLTM